MFQEAALFPWPTLQANVNCRCASTAPPGPDAASAEALLETVHLGGFARKRPRELSGGMRQRVALAQEADLLLMDELFGARDVTHDRTVG